MKHDIGIILAVAIMTLAGCKPYQEERYVEAGTNETVYVIPIDGDAATQVKLDSKEAYEERRVLARRITVPTRWKKTGRFWADGYYIPTVRVIRVNRSPVTREWTADNNSGTSRNNQAIWIESSDSVGFSLGFNCTAMVREEDASLFLYYYPSEKSDGEKGNEDTNSRLAVVIDTEIRGLVQSVSSEVAARYNLDLLRERKNEILDEVRKALIPYFAERGITITTIGMFDGFSYENANIQKSIDDVFIAQQEKNREKALLDAMGSKEQRLKREGEAEAEKFAAIAEKRLETREKEIDVEVQGILKKNTALANASPIYVQLRALEVEQNRVEKWDGKAPQMMMGSNGNGFLPMMQMPMTVTSP